jgi:hypothetical protein
MSDYKYVCAYSDGITPLSAWQAHNYNPLSTLFDGEDIFYANSVKQIASLFEAINDIRDRCCTPTESGGPWVMVYVCSAPGIRPDDEAVMRLTVGPKLGIRTEQLAW